MGGNAPYQQVTRGTSYYGRFIKTIDENNLNWYVKGNADNLWIMSNHNVNDPCTKVNTITGTVPSGNTIDWYPVSDGDLSFSGWRLPEQLEWATLYRPINQAGYAKDAVSNTWSFYQLSSDNNEGAKGWEVKPDGSTTTLFLSCTGFRQASNAELAFQSKSGYYWTIDPSERTIGYSYGINLNSPGGWPDINMAGNWSRGSGLAIRCVKN